MSLNILEKISRQGNAASESSKLLRKGVITPAEHKSLSSLSWQIAANVRANGSSGTLVATKIGPINGFWA